MELRSSVKLLTKVFLKKNALTIATLSRCTMYRGSLIHIVYFGTPKGVRQLIDVPTSLIVSTCKTGKVTWKPRVSLDRTGH